MELQPSCKLFVALFTWEVSVSSDIALKQMEARVKEHDEPMSGESEES
jgi:hypothetical protein